jgi:GrpB-like predicted nucleotidyltransferase (UPF0157 family)
MEVNPPSDFGLLSGELRFVTVGLEWRQRSEEERDRLSNALGRAALDIQHIGSTSVPGIGAAPSRPLEVLAKKARSALRKPQAS